MGTRNFWVDNASKYYVVNYDWDDFILEEAEYWIQGLEEIPECVRDYLEDNEMSIEKIYNDIKEGKDNYYNAFRGCLKELYEMFTTDVYEAAEYNLTSELKEKFRKLFYKNNNWLDNDEKEIGRVEIDIPYFEIEERYLKYFSKDEIESMDEINFDFDDFFLIIKENIGYYRGFVWDYMLVYADYYTGTTYIRNLNELDSELRDSVFDYLWEYVDGDSRTDKEMKELKEVVKELVSDYIILIDNTIKETAKEVEEVFAKNSQHYALMGVFNNGEDIYIKEKENLKESHSLKYEEGYRYYIYIRPGEIYYFEDLQSAEKFQEEYGGEIEKID